MTFSPRHDSFNVHLVKRKYMKIIIQVMQAGGYGSMHFIEANQYLSRHILNCQ